MSRRSRLDLGRANGGAQGGDLREGRARLLCWNWPNKLIAKIASGLKKPDGLTTVTYEEAREFMDPLPIRVIPSIGPKGEAFLHQQNIRLVRELREIPETKLTQWFGSWGLASVRKGSGAR